MSLAPGSLTGVCSSQGPRSCLCSSGWVSHDSATASTGFLNSRDDDGDDNNKKWLLTTGSLCRRWVTEFFHPAPGHVLVTVYVFHCSRQCRWVPRLSWALEGGGLGVCFFPVTSHPTGPRMGSYTPHWAGPAGTQQGAELFGCGCSLPGYTARLGVCVWRGGFGFRLLIKPKENADRGLSPCEVEGTKTAWGPLPWEGTKTGSGGKSISAMAVISMQQLCDRARSQMGLGCQGCVPAPAILPANRQSVRAGLSHIPLA